MRPCLRVVVAQTSRSLRRRLHASRSHSPTLSNWQVRDSDGSSPFSSRVLASRLRYPRMQLGLTCVSVERRCDKGLNLSLSLSGLTLQFVIRSINLALALQFDLVGVGCCVLVLAVGVFAHGSVLQLNTIVSCRGFMSVSGTTGVCVASLH